MRDPPSTYVSRMWRSTLLLWWSTIADDNDFDGVRRYSVIFQDIGWIMDGYWMDIGRILDMDGYWIFADDNALGRVIND